jgi:hypothetical protein
MEGQDLYSLGAQKVMHTYGLSTGTAMISVMFYTLQVQCSF